MKICIVTNEFAPLTGGIATFYGWLAPMLAEAGHKVTVVTPAQNPSPQPHPLIRLVAIDHAPRAERWRLSAKLGVSGSAAHTIGLANQIRDWMVSSGAAESFDVIEAADHLGLAACLIERNLPPVVVCGHGTWGQILQYGGSWPDRPESIIPYLEFVALSTADAVCTHSHLNVDDLRAFLGRDVAFASAPWCPTSFEPRLPRLASPLTAFVVGRLQVWKGAITLADALRVCAKRGIDVVAEWAGGDTGARECNGSVAGYLQMHYPDIWGSRFRWLDRISREEVVKRQRAADVCIVPSLWDTFNLSLLDAMSCGTPTIVSRGAGASMYCRDGENSLVFDAGDAPGLANAIERMNGDMHSREGIGRAGRETLMRELTPERTVSERIGVYSAAIERRRYRDSRHYTEDGFGTLVQRLTLAAQSPGARALAKASLFTGQALKKVGRKIFRGGAPN